MAFRPAIASLSLGRAWMHDLPAKFAAAAAAGLQGIEMFFEDLLHVAAALPGGSDDPANQLLAARRIRSLCDDLGLAVMALGPFRDCEGLTCPTARAAKLQELQEWFAIARALGTTTIQIPSTFLTDGVTGDRDAVVRDLRAIADLGAREDPTVRFVYENLCFATFHDTWEKAWAVVEAVDRPNFGLCLDTFNIAGRGWADPASADGKIDDADAVFAASLAALVRTVDVRKVFYVQVVDAERLSAPLDVAHPFFVPEQKPRMSWSRNARLFMCEEDRGGYLPVEAVLCAICDGLGYTGWVSMELFNRSLEEPGSEVPAAHARRAAESWRRMVAVMGWENRVEELVGRGVREDIATRL